MNPSSEKYWKIAMTFCIFFFLLLHFVSCSWGFNEGWRYAHERAFSDSMSSQLFVSRPFMSNLFASLLLSFSCTIFLGQEERSLQQVKSFQSFSVVNLALNSLRCKNIYLEKKNLWLTNNPALLRALLLFTTAFLTGRLSYSIVKVIGSSLRIKPH